jgi:outer membrane immunogenic protein
MFEYPTLDLKRDTGFVRFALVMLGLAFAAPAHADGYNWTGLYGGVSAGGSWSSAQSDIACTGNSIICTAGIAGGTFVTQATTSLDGFVGGGQVGYNYKTGYWLLGVEADFSGSTVRGSTMIATTAPQLPPATGVDPVTTTLSQDLDWIGTVRGRLGFAGGNWLVYGTGGLAYGHTSFDYAFVNQAAPDNYATASGSTTKIGWTVGGGVEYAFGWATVKTEYLYYDLGTEHLIAQAMSGGSALPIFQEPDFEMSGHIVRAGINFPFND